MKEGVASAIRSTQTNAPVALLQILWKTSVGEQHTGNNQGAEDELDEG